MISTNNDGLTAPTAPYIVGASHGESLQYNPENLLAVLMDHLRLKNDAALVKVLDVKAPTISKIRHRHTPVTATLLLRMHEVSGLSVRDLRFLMGDNRKRFEAINLSEVD